MLYTVYVESDIHPMRWSKEYWDIEAKNEDQLKEKVKGHGGRILEIIKEDGKLKK